MPKVRLLLEKSILHGSVDKLLSGEIDLSLAGCPSEVPGLERLPLETVQLVGCVSRRKLGKISTLTRERLSEIPQILVYDGTIERLQKNLATSKQTFASAMQIFVPDHSMKIEMISAGEGWGLVSTSELKECSHMSLISGKLVPSRSLEICLLRARERALGPIARGIWNQFHQG